MAKIAYLVLTHGSPYQTIDFLWSIWREQDIYFVHIDRKSPPVASVAIGAIAAAYENIHIVPAETCTWGGFTLVDASLRCLMSALAADPEWSHAVLVSGTHFPLQRAESLAAILEPGFSYLTFHDFDISVANLEPPNFWSGVARRLTYEYQEVPGLGRMRGPAKAPPKDVCFHWGSQWWVLSREAAEFVCTTREDALPIYFRNSFIPDESYFQTVLANSPLKKTLKHKQIIWQIWEKGRPRCLDEKELTVALTSKQFFARKASEAAMQDENGILERTIASLDRTSWVESVTQAFATFLPPSISATVSEMYRQRGDRVDVGLAENEEQLRFLLAKNSELINDCVSKHGLAARIASTIPAVNEATLLCEFPTSRTRASYFLILRICNLEIAWLGLYIKSSDMENATADLQNHSSRELFDFDFPLVTELNGYHNILEFGIRRKGVMPLEGGEDANNIRAITQEYVEILLGIPGMIS